MNNLESICSLCKLSLWEWNIQENNFKISGYFGSLEGDLNDFINLFHPEDRYNFEKSIRQYTINKDLFEKTFRIQRGRDFKKWVFVRGSIQTDVQHVMSGVIVGINNLKINHDNRYLHQLELVQFSQHHSRSEVISLLAHELTQPLMVINTYISGCIYRLQENKVNIPQLIEIMTNIKQQAALMGSKIHELKDFLHESHLEYHHVDIHDLINESTLLLADEMQALDLSIDFDFQQNLPSVKMNKNQIKHVLYNLLKESIENGWVEFKNILITTKKIDDSSIKVIIKRCNCKYKKLEKHPSFSTMTNKHEGLQTGLAMCRAIIEAHGGTLSCQTSSKNMLYQFTLHS